MTIRDMKKIYCHPRSGQKCVSHSCFGAVIVLSPQASRYYRHLYDVVERGCSWVGLVPSFFEYWERWNSPYINHFLSPDSIIPEQTNSLSWDRYSYVNNNPVRYTDPSGHMRVEDPGDRRGCTDPKYCQNGRPKQTLSSQAQADVTEWLVGEMDIERWWINEFVQCGHDPICLYRSHLELFGNYGKYDIKRSMLTTIGDAVVICGGSGCRWVDFSAPGNVMYGYLSASRGVPQVVSWAAAGYLERKDSIQTGQPYTGEMSAWGDNPGDKAAVDFGYALYEAYPNGISLEEFQTSLSTDILNSFQAPAAVPSSPAYPAPGSGYPANYFLWPIAPR